VIVAAHALLYVEDAEAARAFFRDVLGLRSVDSGGGWLIFALPPSEIAFHPPATGKEGGTELYLVCDDLATTMKELEAKGVEFTTPVSDEGWGLLTHVRIPGGGELGLYEAKHASPLAEIGGRS
jgi:catechol 2,3-dioxygenase-like lactoylglutathione lyase family enzyme